MKKSLLISAVALMTATLLISFASAKGTVSTKSTTVARTTISGEPKFTKTSTGNIRVTPGTSNVVLFSGRVTSSLPGSHIRQIVINPDRISGVGIRAFISDTISVRVNGAEVGVITKLNQNTPITLSINVDKDHPANITLLGSFKNDKKLEGTYRFAVRISDMIYDAGVAGTMKVVGDRTTLIKKK